MNELWAFFGWDGYEWKHIGYVIGRSNAKLVWDALGTMYYFARKSTQAVPKKWGASWIPLRTNSSDKLGFSAWNFYWYEPVNHMLENEYGWHLDTRAYYDALFKQQRQERLASR